MLMYDTTDCYYFDSDQTGYIKYMFMKQNENKSIYSRIPPRLIKSTSIHSGLM